MSERRSFVEELRRADQARQAERLRPGAVHRIARRLDAELLQAELPTRRRRAFIPMVTFAAGAALVLAVFAFSDGPTRAQRVVESAVPVHASWQVGGSNCHATRGEAELVLDGSCRVQTSEPGLTIESRKTTRLRAVEHGVRLDYGIALFEVEPTTEGPPWRVEVPGGAIEVTGTRFSVVVGGDRGHVDLLEGSIQFVGADGQVHQVEPGERFRFSARGEVVAAAEAPTSPVAAAASAAPSEAPSETQGDTPLAAGERLAALARPEREGRGRGARGQAAPIDDSEELKEIVAQVSELRAQRKYRAAVALLEDALGKRWDRHTREVLSYELGMILSTQLPDRETACAHWDEHRRQFPRGRYGRAIERAQQRLRCSE